jgi:hypothetical protein
MSTKYQQIFIYFVPELIKLLDIRVFNMELSTLSYIEGVKVEIYLSGVLTKTGYTDALGTYKTNVAAGAYVIVLSKDGFNTITKTEVITKPTELMVNLPTKLPISGQSGIIRLFMADHIGNPQITTVNKINLINSKKTATMTLEKAIYRNVTDGKGAAKTASMTTVYQITVA